MSETKETQVSAASSLLTYRQEMAKKYRNPVPQQPSPSATQSPPATQSLSNPVPPTNPVPQQPSPPHQTKHPNIMTLPQLQMNKERAEMSRMAEMKEMKERAEMQMKEMQKEMKEMKEMKDRIGDIAERYRLHRNIHVEPQQPSPPHQIIHMEDRKKISNTIIIHVEDRKISQTEGANTIKFFSSFYGIIQVGILTAVFSSQQRKGLCKDSWGLLVLSAIVSGGVLIALLWIYCQQFLLLRRGRRRLIRWITQRAAIVIAFMTLSICLWLSCKSRLSC